MLAVLATAVGCLGVLLLQGSFVYYRHPRAPEWLRSRPNTQVLISVLFACGTMASLMLFASYFADHAIGDLRPVEIASILCLVAGAVWLHRKIGKWSKALDATKSVATPDVIYPDFENTAQDTPPKSHRRKVV